ncbi:MAG: hypothetical protein IT581_02790 [Verrucomicrobiales bacterium]|nr:hypothetical protein [Verrucomicrobiales bacterium]
MNHSKSCLSVGWWRVAPLCAALVGPVAVRGEINGSFVINGDGTVTYFYEVDNRAGLFDIAQWTLEFPFAAPDWDSLDTFSGGEVGVPNPGWFADSGVPIVGLAAQDFLSLNLDFDVRTGETQGGFWFTSRYQPGEITYHEFSATGDSASGLTLGPVITTAVPEAGGWVTGVALVGLMGLSAVRWNRRTGVQS